VATGLGAYLVTRSVPEWHPYLDPARAALIFGGLVAAGAAVARRLRTTGWVFEERVETATLLFAAAVVAGVAALGAEDADTLQTALAVLAAVAGVGVGLVLLPRAARHVAVSLLVVLHFSSITTSVLCVPPPRSTPPWLLQTAWAFFYRPYSSFMYLNNAYHFYSPEPGPPTLVWFFVRYSDGSSRWVKLPSRAESPVPLHYQRMLALTESTNMISQALPLDFNDRARRRMLAGRQFSPEIPLPAELPPNLQLQIPEDYSKVMVSAYARFVARRYPHPDAPGSDPDAEVTGVKAYRVVHSIVNAPDLARGVSPLSKMLDLPYFQGEFDREGKLKDPDDPFLYWIVPIIARSRSDPQLTTYRAPALPLGELVVDDYLEVHARHPDPAKQFSQEVLP
jgi:hypothetical protein